MGIRGGMSHSAVQCRARGGSMFGASFACAPDRGFYRRIGGGNSWRWGEAGLALRRPAQRSRGTPRSTRLSTLRRKNGDVLGVVAGGRFTGGTGVLLSS
jgi:hypothetical protein